MKWTKSVTTVDNQLDRIICGTKRVSVVPKTNWSVSRGTKYVVNSYKIKKTEIILLTEMQNQISDFRNIYKIS